MLKRTFPKNHLLPFLRMGIIKHVFLTIVYDLDCSGKPYHSNRIMNVEHSNSDCHGLERNEIMQYGLVA